MVCPGNPCQVTLIDDHAGDDVFYKVCVHSEPFCRPPSYLGTSYITVTPGSIIDVVPRVNQATTGTVTVS